MYVNHTDDHEYKFLFQFHETSSYTQLSTINSDITCMSFANYETFNHERTAYTGEIEYHMICMLYLGYFDCFSFFD